MNRRRLPAGRRARKHSHRRHAPRDDGSARGIAAVILAAGASRRIGQPKLLLTFQGQPLLRRAIDAAAGAGCTQILVVLGADRQRYLPLLAGTPAREVYNKDYPEGMSSSIRAAIHALAARTDAAIVMLADQPRIDAQILLRIIAAYRASGREIVASQYGPVIGAPTLFDRALFLELLLLEGDQGARAVVDTHPGEVAVVEIPPIAGADIDVPEDVVGLQGP